MPSNPIQRKTRNSFLLGMLIMLIIAIAVVAILYFVVFSDAITNAQDKGKNGIAYAYRLTAGIKSGDTIQIGKVEKVELYVDDLPADYINASVDVTTFKAKVALQAGTILSSSLLYQDEMVANSTRLMEYNMLTLPSTLSVGDYIDVRLTMPSGQNYIVLSKKQVMSLNNTTVGLYLTEDEILMMTGAIIDSYIMKASDLNAVQYVEAGLQQASTPTYSVNAEVYQLIQANSQKGFNIEDYAKINDSYNSNLRAIIDQELGQYAETGLTNIEEGIEEQKKTSMELYLSGLEGY